MKVTIEIAPHNEAGFKQAVSRYAEATGVPEDMARGHVVNACLQGHLGRFCEALDNITGKPPSKGFLAGVARKRAAGAGGRYA